MSDNYVVFEVAGFSIVQHPKEHLTELEKKLTVIIISLLNKI
jgi:hypothetical protein